MSTTYLIQYCHVKYSTLKFTRETCCFIFKVNTTCNTRYRKKCIFVSFTMSLITLFWAQKPWLILNGSLNWDNSIWSYLIWLCNCIFYFQLKVSGLKLTPFFKSVILYFVIFSFDFWNSNLLSIVAKCLPIYCLMAFVLLSGFNFSKE